ncbi:iron-sulfur cluster assembly scaffold protein [Alteriqipengyuania lutimaris]|uniref:Iron-sulfur cluster assembly scaffold protein n=1 Tax=Alteriqipengyuania lutimaris TaxID=1538146 RepID=A0A395LM02_9SPHN|nr:iron-sulfur cluster assembly scaffold protein [Alteriqipengyuania lutimaris]MBB3032883.1 NifU-like protein involved in Fe-S cluster formation [Alteriqipengyuania lutimaris]RDS78028.1 iron-sulfur cluster assembly scaffold protein [Alteriqipengyuania lutimaris]
MTRLYTPDILALAVELADHPRLATPDVSAQVRSRTCGGTLTLDLALDDAGRIDALGLAVSACAIGQAAAAIFAREARGRGAEEILAAHGEIETWLAGDGPEPRWPGIAILAPATEYPARHGAIMLPWNAGVDALCKEHQQR